jgi:hypothetical protein
MVAPDTSIRLSVNDIVSYLSNAGWERDPDGRVWHYSGDYEVLVPGRDGLRDGDRRVREILRCLSAVEDRPADGIATDIARPHLDKQFFRTYPAGHDSGYTALHSGVQTLQGIWALLAAAARTVLQGPHFSFVGRAPAAVSEILRAAELGPSRAGSYVVEVRLAADVTAHASGGAAIGSRAVLVQTLEAVSAVKAAVALSEPEAFDETVTAGVSADLCTALSDLSGPRRNEPFDISFRWARSQPLEAPSHSIAFPEGSGSLLQSVAERLRGQNASGPATVTGVVEGLHDDAAGGDRWRMRVRGELRTEQNDQAERSRRAVWVRLADQVAYERAITAHRERLVITVAGELSSTTGRVELVPGHRFEF